MVMVSDTNGDGQWHQWSLSVTPMVMVSDTNGHGQWHQWSWTVTPMVTVSDTNGRGQWHQWSSRVTPMVVVSDTNGRGQWHQWTSTPVSDTNGHGQWHYQNPIGIQMCAHTGGWLWCTTNPQFDGWNSTLIKATVPMTAFFQVIIRSWLKASIYGHRPSWMRSQ